MLYLSPEPPSFDYPNNVWWTIKCVFFSPLLFNFLQSIVIVCLSVSYAQINSSSVFRQPPPVYLEWRCTLLRLYIIYVDEYWAFLVWYWQGDIQDPPKTMYTHFNERKLYVVWSIIVNLQYISVNTIIWYMYLLQYNIYSYSSYMFRLLWVIFRH